MSRLTLIALAPTFLKGVLVYVSAFVLFVGSVYLLAGAVLGLRMGYLVIAVAFFGWMIILSALWMFGAPGTLKNLGPQGTAAHWQVVAAGTRTLDTTYPESATFPGSPWWTAPPNTVAASAVPTVTSAFQIYLVAQAQEAAKQGTGQELLPTEFVVQNVRFATAEDGTHLAAGQAFFVSGGPAITLMAYHDSGNLPVYSLGALLLSLIGFAIHLPFLDRAEKSRKEILTGGTAPPWFGPA